jgi:hypothetical protein
MKIIQENPLAEAQIKIEAEAMNPRQIERKQLSEYRKEIDGGTIFEIDRKTGEVSKARFRADESKEISLAASFEPVKEKLDTQAGKIYVEALNARNALKRAMKGKYFFAT